MSNSLSLNFTDSIAESRSAPLQLLERSVDDTIDDVKDSDEESHKDEEFSLLGYTMCIKRQKRGESASSCSSSSSLHPFKKHAPDPDLEKRRSEVKSWGNQPLAAADPDLFEIMEKEKQRQVKGIELIASENFVCKAVLDCLGSHSTNKYSEGMVRARYYCGNQYIDQIEKMCCERALAAFGLDKDCWGVNVQAYSCTSANFAVFTGLLLWKDRIMGLETLSGGHVSHGYYTPSGKKVSGASIFFESLPYKVNPHTGYIDYDKVEERAMDFHPKILICGGSSYPREWDYARFRKIADKCGAVLMCDMAQISGLVAAKVKKNAQVLASALLRRKCILVTGGTDNHLILWDLRTLGLTGKIFEKVCEACHISLNKTPIFGGNGCISPGGVRIGTPAMTTRGCLEGDFETIAEFLLRASQIACSLQREHGKFQKEFVKGLLNNRDIAELRYRVESFSSQFAMPGFDV